MKKLLIALPLALSSLACDEDGEAAARPAEGPEPGESALEYMRSEAAELARRPEHDAEQVEVQHLLIAFEGAERSRATRSRAEAEELAAELYVRAKSGEEFDDLVAEHTDDSHPGIYTMASGGQAPGAYPRQGMASAFGDVGWRLEVGEIGVAPHDPEASPFGWHLIKRLN